MLIGVTVHFDDFIMPEVGVKPRFPCTIVSPKKEQQQVPRRPRKVRLHCGRPQLIFPRARKVVLGLLACQRLRLQADTSQGWIVPLSSNCQC